MRKTLATWPLATVLFAMTASYSPLTWGDFMAPTTTVGAYVDTPDGSAEAGDGDLLSTPFTVSGWAETDFVSQTIFHYIIETGGVEITNLFVSAHVDMTNDHVIDGGPMFVGIDLFDFGWAIGYGALFELDACTICVVEFTLAALPAWGSVAIFGDATYGYNAGFGVEFVEYFIEPPPFGAMLAIGEAITPSVAVPTPGALGLVLFAMVILAMTVVSNGHVHLRVVRAR